MKKLILKLKLNLIYQSNNYCFFPTNNPINCVQNRAFI
ncbi:hypothetical protein M595_2736 [Lyngbya aestuarii BL J]|uniref:Uncharacterized protein n=1 Tax=Lyngbya aestuarii BL J TaxID=1348334 RepID=U7QJK4_9CYAN|nr:hypothetical protein M595_2736 [Lyngbya aestuarii BL J]